MSDFRKCLFAFAVIALLVAAVPAGAQTITCTAGSNVLPIHAEGYTELVGAVSITCPSAPAGDVQINLTMGSNITSKLTSSTVSSAYVSSDAAGMSSIATGAYSSAAPTQLVFTVPAASASKTMYIQNVLIDATKYATSGSGSFVSAIVYLTSGTTPVPATLSNGVATVNVAIAQTSMGATSILDSASKSGFVFPIKQCSSNNSSLKNGDATPTAADLTLSIPEGFQAAWAPATIGAAGTSGTVLLTFANVPTGVTIFLPGTIPATSTTVGATLAIGASAAGDITGTGVTAGTAGKVYLYTPVAGTVTATYTLDAPAVATTLSVPVYLSYGAGASAVTPGANSATVKAELAPVLPGANTATKDGPPPTRYNTTTVTPANFLAFSKCNCSILFPFVSSLAPFDTGLAVSNTSSDPYGTAAQTGDVTFNFYGTNAPAKKVVSAVAGGSQAIFSLSDVAKGFTGYVIAQTDFQYCHGFAMIMPVGAVGNVASSGYLGIVLNVTGTTRNETGALGN